MPDVHNLTVFFENALALNDFSMKVEEVQIVGVIGCNSAGKTILMNTLSGLIIDMAIKEKRKGGERITIYGKIFFKGEDITEVKPSDRVRKGIVLSRERHPVFPESSIVENHRIAGYLRTRSQVREVMDSVFKLFPALLSLKSRKAGFLSGVLWERLSSRDARGIMTGGSHRLRKGRTQIENQKYFITTAVRDRAPVLANPEAANIVLSALKWLETYNRMLLDVAVVMPDHLHFIATLKDGELSRLMQSLKGYTSRQINTLLNKKGAFWQDQYHEHAVRKDEDLKAVVLYMLHHPVRAGLVEDFHQYPFWYCRWAV